MARSLTVQHIETPSTSPLLTAFLLLAFGWLGLTTAFAMNAGGGTTDSTLIDVE